MGPWTSQCFGISMDLGYGLFWHDGILILTFRRLHNFDHVLGRSPGCCSSW